MLVFSFQLVLAEEASTTPQEIQEQEQATSTPEIIPSETESPAEESQATSTEPIIEEEEIVIVEEELIVEESLPIEPIEPTESGEDNSMIMEELRALKEMINSSQQPQSSPDSSAKISEPKEAYVQPIDIATAPSAVTIKVLMPDASPPPFPVFVTFVGVGNKNFGGEVNANGELSVIMPQGRYYTELMIINTEYIQGEDGPSFFLEANEERDLGLIRLIPKSEQSKRGQPLKDQTLEANILTEAGEAKGIGKILVLIVKLLMQILEEIRAIAGRLA